MAKAQKFNSKEELDYLFELLEEETPIAPSDKVNFYNKIERYLVRIHEKSYKKGHKKGYKKGRKLAVNAYVNDIPVTFAAIDFAGFSKKPTDMSPPYQMIDDIE